MFYHMKEKNQAVCNDMSILTYLTSSTLQTHHMSFHACVLKVYVRELFQ